jgi:hypothetical protein
MEYEPVKTDVVTRGVQDVNCIGRELEKECEKWRLKNKLWKNEIFRYRSFKGIAYQWGYNRNCKTV